MFYHMNQKRMVTKLILFLKYFSLIEFGNHKKRSHVLKLKIICNVFST